MEIVGWYNLALNYQLFSERFICHLSIFIYHQSVYQLSYICYHLPIIYLVMDLCIYFISQSIIYHHHLSICLYKYLGCVFYPSLEWDKYLLVPLHSESHLFFFSIIHQHPQFCIAGIVANSHSDIFPYSLFCTCDLLKHNYQNNSMIFHSKSKTGTLIEDCYRKSRQSSY